MSARQFCTLVRFSVLVSSLVMLAACGKSSTRPASAPRPPVAPGVFNPEPPMPPAQVVPPEPVVNFNDDFQRSSPALVPPPPAVVPSRISLTPPFAHRVEPVDEVPESIFEPSVPPAEAAEEVAEAEEAALDENDAADFEVSTALDGLGNWVTIGNERYFHPALLPEEVNWQPYQHGRWIFDSKRGWTWESYDRWGDITEHYGVWRHHHLHGWVWLPFPDRIYRPACVTWFDDSDKYVGWYPYYRGYGYVLNESVGFDDHYWEGYRAAARVNREAFAVNFGFTMVTRQNVLQASIFEIRIQNNQTLFSIAARAHAPDRILAHHVGFFPGGNRDHAYAFLQVRAKTAPSWIEPKVFGETHHFIAPPPPAALPTLEQNRMAAWNKLHADAPKPILPRTPMAKPVPPAKAPGTPPVKPPVVAKPGPGPAPNAPAPKPPQKQAGAPGTPAAPGAPATTPVKPNPKDPPVHRRGQAPAGQAPAPNAPVPKPPQKQAGAPGAPATPPVKPSPKDSPVHRREQAPAGQAQAPNPLKQAGPPAAPAVKPPAKNAPAASPKVANNPDKGKPANTPAPAPNVKPPQRPDSATGAAKADKGPQPQADKPAEKANPRRKA